MKLSLEMVSKKYPFFFRHISWYIFEYISQDVLTPRQNYVSRLERWKDCFRKK